MRHLLLILTVLALGCSVQDETPAPTSAIDLGTQFERSRTIEVIEIDNIIDDGGLFRITDEESSIALSAAAERGHANCPGWPEHPEQDTDAALAHARCMSNLLRRIIEMKKSGGYRR